MPGGKVSNNQTVAAIVGGTIGAIATLIAALIAIPEHSSSASQLTKATRSHSAVKRSPRTSSPTHGPPVAASSSSSASPSSGHSPKPTATASIPILQPKNQAGWNLAWHGDVHIGLEGIILTTTGPKAGNGEDFDLQYAPGENDPWQIGDYIDQLAYWQHKYRPGPSSINGMFDSNNWPGVTHSAYAGDRICVGDSGRIDTPIITYMQVTAVKATGVKVDMWIWESP